MTRLSWAGMTRLSWAGMTRLSWGGMTRKAAGVREGERDVLRGIHAPMKRA